MKSILIAFVSFTTCLTTHHVQAQIFEADSTVQVVGYWSKGDKQSFVVKHEKYSVTGTDTTDREVTKTEVDVTVVDSSATSYTIEWLYKTVTSTNKDPLLQRFFRLAQNVKFVISTDELGSFREVTNVKDLQDYAAHAKDILKRELKSTKGADAMVNAIFASFDSKESIENNLIDEIYQFYFFHGGKYKIDEPATIKLELPNASGGKPIDAELVIKLTEINAADDNYVIRSAQLVDKAQATEATFQILLQNNELEPGFTRDQMPEVVIQEDIAARVHSSGWTTYSSKTKSVITGDSADVEEWTIELQ